MRIDRSLCVVALAVLGAVPAFGARARYETLVPTAQREAAEWRYTTTAPSGDAWKTVAFDDSGWKRGRSGFGTRGTPGAVVRTVWNTDDIWLRREVTLPEGDLSKAALLLHHDEDAEVYLNGVPAAEEHGFIGDYQMTPIAPAARQALHAGKNVIAVHCHQTTGGQYIDVGLVIPKQGGTQEYIPPAVPLIVHDPYFSVWQEADELNDDWARHWTGAPNALSSVLHVDGKEYRLMGAAEGNTPALKQDSVEVLPTRTIYHFSNETVKATLTFTTPAIASDLEVLARPVTYLTWEVASADGKGHQASVDFAASGQLAAMDAQQEVKAEKASAPGLEVMRLGTTEQPVLKRRGDRTRIDWGYLYVAGPEGQAKAEIAKLDGSPAVQFSVDLGQVSDAPVSRTLMVAYDEVDSIQLMGKNLRPYWQHAGATPETLLATAWKDFPSLQKRCAAFDDELMADLKKAGGENYARIGAAAYRQALAGDGLAASEEGKPLMFPKENTSNGCIATVDVHYPAAPIFALFNPGLLEAQLTPVFDYAESPRWKWPFAPHDLGTYPQANGQVYGGGERTEENQMPVEESGNMILMVAAIAKARGDASYAEKHWATLTKWTAYLKDKGFDPENQLCTDDFMGHLAHNVNLSAKTIEAIGAYGMLADMLGHKAEAEQCREMAKSFAARWVKEADDGDHYRLAFDRPGTWSQKYNLVWDRLLGLNLFPPADLQKEFAFYVSHQHEYGLPLDSRAQLTKTDWLVWTATLTGSQKDFDSLVAPIAKFLADSPSRVPFADIYDINNAQQRGMYARPVIGGVFIKLMDDPATWQKWASRAR